MDLQLTDKRGLVTGSSAGIGKAIARTLAAEGAVVVITGRDGRGRDSRPERHGPVPNPDRLSAKEVDELEMRMVRFLGHDRMARWIQEGADPVAQEINGSASVVR